jgi:hypothetical protein
VFIVAIGIFIVEADLTPFRRRWGAIGGSFPSRISNTCAKHRYSRGGPRMTIVAPWRRRHYRRSKKTDAIVRSIRLGVQARQFAGVSEVAHRAIES